MLHEVDGLVRTLTFEDCFEEGRRTGPQSRMLDTIEEGPKSHSTGTSSSNISPPATEELEVSSEGIEDLEGVKKLGGEGLGSEGRKVTRGVIIEPVEVSSDKEGLKVSTLITLFHLHLQLSSLSFIPRNVGGKLFELSVCFCL